MSLLGEHAAIYGGKALEVFPVNPADKTPLVSQYEATIDVDQITRWWDQWPDALIGHRVAADEVITDIDPRHGGHQTWAALRIEAGAWPVSRGHASGRGDGGGHIWWLRPDDRLSTVALDAWAKERGLGQDVGGGRWSAGIDLLQRDHRYSILPPSPHPDTGRPYVWVHGLEVPPSPMPGLLADLLTDVPILVPRPTSEPQPDSIADWYTAMHSWTTLLHAHGWVLRAGDGDSDRSRWRHPTATSAFSATIRHGCLFVYSPNTPFEVTTPSEPHGYTLFRAWAVLDHQGDMTAAARAARTLKGDDAGDLLAKLAGQVPPTPANDATAQERHPSGGVVVHLNPAGGIVMDTPRWVWHQRIPIGGVTLMAGREGMGKTALAIHLAAQMTTGALAGEWEGQPREVIYVGHEDDRASVLVPRLAAAGADLGRFLFVDLDDQAFNVVDHVGALADALVDRPVGMVIIDPLDSHLGMGVDTHKKAEVQATIEALARLAQRLRCGVLGIGHLNKAPVRELLTKVIGSVGFTTSVRSVLAVGEHPQEKREALCILAKANMTNRHDVGAIRFRVVESFVDHPGGGVAITTARVEILGEEAEIDANILLGSEGPEGSELRDAKGAILDLLTGSPGILTKEVEEAARELYGVSKRTLVRARKALGVIAFRQDDKWWLRLPVDADVRNKGAVHDEWHPSPEEGSEAVPQCRFGPGSLDCILGPNCPNPNHRGPRR